MSNTCGLSEWRELCGAVKFKFTISISNEEITEFPFKGLSWEESALEFTLKPATDADSGDHSVTLNILHELHPELNQVFKIFLASRPQCLKIFKITTLKSDLITMTPILQIKLAVPLNRTELSYAAYASTQPNENTAHSASSTAV